MIATMTIFTMFTEAAFFATQTAIFILSDWLIDT